MSDMWADILRVYERCADLPAPAAPVKFTAAQWEYVKSVIPPRPPAWALSPGPLPGLSITDVQVEIVDTDEESTPIRENWGWGARLAEQQWPGAWADFQRRCEEADRGHR